MRVAFDVSSILGVRTGIGHYSSTLLREIESIEDDIQIIPYALTSKSDTSELPDAMGKSLKRISIPGRLLVTAWSALGRPDADGLLGDPDVVHGANFWVPPLARRNGIVTIHDLGFWLYPELCTTQIQRYRWIVPKALRHCSLVLTPSNTIAEQIEAELAFPADRIVVTPEGVRGAFVGASPDPDVLARIGAKSPYVLFAGTQEPRKNLDRLIEALALCPDDLHLVIAGPPGWGSVDLPAVARKLHLEERVVFSGYLTDSELAGLMAGARAFAFPSIYEGFGLPPLEAMAAGIPVVAARSGSLPEVLQDAPFWCDAEDVASIAESLVAAVTDEDARKAAVAAGLRVASGYDWTSTARLTVEAYRRVADGI